MDKKRTKDLERMISNNWATLAVPGRLEAGCPPPFRIQSSFYYDGGTITLFADKTEILEVERDAEFATLDVRIPDAMMAREEKILGIMEQLCNRAIQRGIQESEMAKKAKVNQVFDMIDALPDEVGVPETMWAIAEIGHIGRGFLAGPFPTIELAMEYVDEHIAVEIGAKSDKPLRGFTLKDGALTWYDAEACLQLKAPEPDSFPEPGQ